MRPFRYLLAALCLLATPALAQVPMTGAGLGKPGGVAPYVGPLDLGITAYKEVYSVQCAGTSYTGSVIDVVYLTVTYTITCSSGGIVNIPLGLGVLPGSNCTGTACTVSGWYDQSGNNLCSSAPCNMSAGTAPNYVQSCNGGVPCLRFASGSSQYLHNTSYASPGTSPALTVVGSRTGAFTSYGAFVSGTTTATEVPTIFASNSANTWAGAGSTFITFAATDSAWHIATIAFAGSSGFYNIDGAITASQNFGIQALTTGSLAIGRQEVSAGHDYLTGDVSEIIVWASLTQANSTTYYNNAVARGL